MDAYVKGIVAEYNLKEDMLSVFCLSTKKVVEVFLDGMFSDIYTTSLEMNLPEKMLKLPEMCRFHLVIWLYGQKSLICMLTVVS